MWEERRGIYWKDFNGVKLTVGVPEYGWTVFNQVIKSSQLALSQDYEYFYLMCYDTIIGDTVINSINNPSSCITFKHYKNENFLSNATLIFSCFNKSNLSQLISLFNREEYAKNYHLVAEDYLEEKLSLLKTCTFSKFQVTDQFHESTDIFNLNLYNDKFKIFISNEGELKSLVYDVQEEFILIVNNQAYNINPNVFEVLDLSNHNIINNLGFFIEGEYYNLLPSYNKLTTKVIENIWLPQ